MTIAAANAPSKCVRFIFIAIELQLSSPCSYCCVFSTVAASLVFAVVHKNKLKGLPLRAFQFYALFTKRLLHALRHPVTSLIQLVIPVVYTLVVVLVLRQESRHDTPPLTFKYVMFIWIGRSYNTSIKGLSSGASMLNETAAYFVCNWGERAGGRVS